MIGIVDYRAGNATSVGYAFARLGVGTRLVATPEGMADADRLVLPGVGAARATLASLGDAGLLEPLADAVLTRGVPFLGICIGLQILFEHSEEGANPEPVRGLGWLAGEIRRLPDTERVPQIGWNEVRFTRRHPLVDELPEPSYCYFVNSYYAVPTDSADTLGVTDYGVELASMVARGNIAATQFHAEKSGEIGLRLLQSFASWGGGPC